MSSRSTGTILPTMRKLPIGEETIFPLENLGALRTASWFLAKNEKKFYEVHKCINGVYVIRRA